MKKPEVYPLSYSTCGLNSPPPLFSSCMMVTPLLVMFCALFPLFAGIYLQVLVHLITFSLTYIDDKFSRSNTMLNLLVTIIQRSGCFYRKLNSKFFHRRNISNCEYHIKLTVLLFQMKLK